MPFIADEIYQKVKTDSDPESVHLAGWPRRAEKNWFGMFAHKNINTKLLSDMAEVRRVVSLGLEKRSSAGLKVRQPLGTLATKSKVAVAFGKGLILDEVNVKNVVFDPTLSEDVVLDTTITPELKEEGELREVVRAIQDMRKKAGLSPHDDAVLIVDSVHEDMIAKNWTYIKNAARLTAKEKGETLNVRKS